MSARKPKRGCPFCGANDLSVVSTAATPNVNRKRVHCGRCGAQGPIEFSHAAAIYSWDERYEPASERQGSGR